MKNNERGDQIERSEVWTIAIVVPLFVLLVQVVVVAVCWDRLCAKIAINALEYGMEQMAVAAYREQTIPNKSRQVTSYRPRAPQQSTQAYMVDHQKELEEWLDAQPDASRTWENVERWAEKMMRENPETHDEALERIKREAREVDSVWLKDSDPYR